MKNFTSSPKLKLLIVEDDEELREVLRDIAENSLNCEVRCESNGSLGLKAIEEGMNKSEPFSAILTDIKMPVMDGIEMLVEIRKREIFTPVIVLTGHGDKESTVRALQLGAYDFIDKPFELNRLINGLRSALDLGESFHSIDEEIVQIVGKLNLNEEDSERLKKLKRTFLMAKKNTPFG